MIYKNYKIRASVPDWYYYELDDDGNIAELIDNGGVDLNAAEYDIYTNDEDDESVDGGYETLEEAKAAIDKLVKG